MILNQSMQKLLSYYLYVFGLGNIFVHPIIPWIFPDQFFWTPRNVPYEFMIGGIYIALGVVMTLAAKHPARHKLFVDFVILGNFVHAAVMIAFGIIDQPAHLYGDVLWITALWLFPLLFYPWGLRNFLNPGMATDLGA